MLKEIFSLFYVANLNRTKQLMGLPLRGVKLIKNCLLRTATLQDKQLLMAKDDEKIKTITLDTIADFKCFASVGLRKTDDPDTISHQSPVINPRHTHF